MPRQPRSTVLTKESVFHVIARGNNRMRLFKDDDDYKAYLSLLEAYKGIFGIFIHHYVLMPNHVHILLNPKRDLPNFLKIVQHAYARRFNKKYRHVGHVWSGRYKSPRIESDSYLFACGNYIEMNP